LNFALLYWGFLGVNSDTASTVYAAGPLAILILTVSFRMEKFSWRHLAVAFVGLLGVAVIFEASLI
jgi:drug/metabolite transporter (DMT)-like permease